MHREDWWHMSFPPSAGQQCDQDRSQTQDSVWFNTNLRSFVASN